MSRHDGPPPASAGVGYRRQPPPAQPGGNHICDLVLSLGAYASSRILRAEHDLLRRLGSASAGPPRSIVLLLGGRRAQPWRNSKRICWTSTGSSPRARFRASNHDWYQNPASKVSQPVPRHRDIKAHWRSTSSRCSSDCDGHPLEDGHLPATTGVFDLVPQAPLCSLDALHLVVARAIGT